MLTRQLSATTSGSQIRMWAGARPVGYLRVRAGLHDFVDLENTPGAWASQTATPSGRPIGLGS